jgi:hypothetical protein
MRTKERRQEGRETMTSPNILDRSLEDQYMKDKEQPLPARAGRALTHKETYEGRGITLSTGMTS